MHSGLFVSYHVEHFPLWAERQQSAVVKIKIDDTKRITDNSVSQGDDFNLVLVF